MEIGARAHDFGGKQLVKDLADQISEKGFPFIQLALRKAVADIDYRYGILSPGFATYVKDTLADKGIKIAVLGCYINPVHPDLDIRRNMLDTFKEHIRFARDFGCSIVATETGSLNPDYSFNNGNRTEEAFNTLVQSISELVEEAEKFGVFVCVEGVSKYTMYDPKTIKRVLDTVKSNNLQILYDPSNLITMDNYKKQDDIIKESFELFGDRIIAAHAKDVTIQDSKIVTCNVGHGFLNLELFSSLLKQCKPHVNILLEDVKNKEFDEGIAYMNDMFNRI